MHCSTCCYLLNLIPKAQHQQRVRSLLGPLTRLPISQGLASCDHGNGSDSSVPTKSGSTWLADVYTGLSMFLCKTFWLQKLSMFTPASFTQTSDCQWWCAKTMFPFNVYNSCSYLVWKPSVSVQQLQSQLSGRFDQQSPTLQRWSQEAEHDNNI